MTDKEKKDLQMLSEKRHLTRYEKEYEDELWDKYFIEREKEMKH